jgi:hypothetical protein
MPARVTRARLAMPRALFADPYGHVRFAAEIRQLISCHGNPRVRCGSSAKARPLRPMQRVAQSSAPSLPFSRIWAALSELEASSIILGRALPQSAEPRPYPFENACRGPAHGARADTVDPHRYAQQNQARKRAGDLHGKAASSGWTDQDADMINPARQVIDGQARSDRVTRLPTQARNSRSAANGASAHGRIHKPNRPVSFPELIEQ